MDPARMFKESLTSRPELENSQDPNRTLRVPRRNCGILHHARQLLQRIGRPTSSTHRRGSRPAWSARRVSDRAITSVGRLTWT